MKILDATAGSRGIWYQKDLPFVTWMDKRKGKYTSYISPKDKRVINVNPDVVADWTKTIPFENNYFDMVVFDPPHLVKKPCKKLSRMEYQYTSLNKDTWKQDLQKGFNELFRVLKPYGFLVLKWCETNIKIMDVVGLSPYKPMFSNMSLERNGSDRNNYMVIFSKFDVNKKLELET